MNSQQLSDLFGMRRPKCKEKYRDLLSGIATEGDKTGKGGISALGALGQSFMYAFMIGHKLKQGRLNDEDFIAKDEKTFDIAPFGNWKPAAIRDYIILMLLNESEETGVEWSALDDADEDNIENWVKELIKRMEAYANAGFEYLNQKWLKERYEFDDPFVFVNFLRQISLETK